MILIIDFGSQTTHLIARRIRDIGVPVKIINPEEIIETVSLSKPKGIILSGGPASVYEKGAPTIDPKIFSLNIPVLAICYGWQLMAKLLGGTVKNTKKEYGPEDLILITPKSIYSLPQYKSTVFLSHGDSVTKLPKGFSVYGKTKKVRFAAVAHMKQKLFGVQFHPEAHHTEQGAQLLSNFVTDVCHESPSHLAVNPDEIISDIKKRVGNESVLMAVSGGVDSTVAAFLIGKAIGQHLIPVYVESGLMRPDTVVHVRHIFTKLIPSHLFVAHKEKQFMSALKGITDPEIKRKIIGKLYIDIFQDIAKRHNNVSFLGQGTIYSDVIESKGSTLASHIKSHHNVGGLPKHMKLTILEPLRNYYKDEVKKIGTLLKLPDDVVAQQPFPGPGFAVRIRGEMTPKRLAQVKQADAIVLEELKKAKIYKKAFQCFAVMTGAYSTAVKGDGRVYAEVVAIRAYESVDIMTSQWARIPYDVLQKISSRIVNEVADVSRVVYDITTKPPATMEWE